jgi:RHS repeat-associated protein
MKNDIHRSCGQTHVSSIAQGTVGKRVASLFVVVLSLATIAPLAVADAATPSRNVSPARTRLYVGSALGVGQRLTSSSGKYSVELLSNGQIEVEKRDRVVWVSDAGTGLSRILSRDRNGAAQIASQVARAHLSGMTKTDEASYLMVTNNGDVALISKSGVTLWQAGVKAHVSGAATVAPYTRGELFGGSNPAAKCYTCDAANITGSAPPSNTLDSGTDVDAMTGDFSTSNTLFDAPAIGGDLSISLGYDAELAQSELSTGVTSGSDPFGVGWSSNYSDSVTPGTDSYGVSDITVNQANGSQMVFTESNEGGTSTSCQESGDPSTYAAAYAGDDPFTSRYTVSGSTFNFCALASVQGQLSEVSSTGYTYDVQGGQSVQDFAWDGQLEATTTAAASSAAGIVFYGATEGTSSVGGHTLTNPCPTTASYGCTMIYSNDYRDVVEVLNSVSQVGSIVAPSGATYTLTYSPASTVTSNLVSIGEPSPTGSSTATWNYLYSTAASPDSSNLTAIDDPDYNASSSTYAHTTTINYDSSSSSTPGMVSSLVDGSGTSGAAPGATTTYGYSAPCALGQCTVVGASQTTTIEYPSQVLCPGSDAGCAATSPQEIDQYTAGLETSTELGSPNSPLDNETWTYGWDLGDGLANTTEVVSYPDSLNVAQNSTWVSPTATIISDPEGNVVSTTNALGDTSTSEYNDAGSNDFNELLWSFPGPTSNTTTAPSGASVETYNSFGQVVTATDPLGNVTSYGYYGTYSLPCYVAPPSVSAFEGWTATSSAQPTSCTNSPTSSTPTTSLPTGAPLGSTTYAYDLEGNVTATIVDVGDTGAGADPQTTTASFDVMGNQLWTVPPTGQGGSQSSSNPYATSTSYVTGTSLPAIITDPDAMSTTDSYDAASNLVSTGNKNDASMWMFTTTVYDGDNRPCYQEQGSGLYGAGCPTSTTLEPNLAGSTQWTYVPGSTNVATQADSNDNVTRSYYGDLSYPNQVTEVVDPSMTTIQYSAFDDYGNTCVTGDVQALSSFPYPTTGLAMGSSTQCSTVSGDTTTVFTSLGSAASVIDPSGNTTTNVYANSSYPTLVTSTTNVAGAITSYGYDADGNLLLTTYPAGPGAAVGYAYNSNGEVCSKAPTALPHPCGSGPSKGGVTQYLYNDAGDVTTMSDNVANPGTPTQWSQVTTYSYSNGQLVSTTDSNNKTVSYQYNDAGQVSCIAYPVSTSATCSSPGSTTNTTVARTYDSEGRLSTVIDWLGHTTTYAYTDYWTPYAPTSITYPFAIGVTATYGYSNSGNVTSLAAASTVTSGTAISDSWTQNPDEQVATTSINGSTPSSDSYDANARVTHAANLASSTSDDVFTNAANGEITNDEAPSGSNTSFGYNSGEELCSVNASSTASCSTAPSNGAVFSYTANGQRTTATTYSGGTAGATTNYAWNAFGELCNVAASSTACGTTPSSGTGYSYNGNGVRMTAATSTSSTDFTWDNVAGGNTPLDINDATTTSSGSTNTSYVYGNLLFGGTAPVEQITTTSSGATVSYLVSNQTGVQGVYNGSGSSLGAVQEMATYSVYGVQSVIGSKVTPFGFQGSYTDPTGFIYLINRYYDPATDQFLSIDPDVATTNQPYVFTNDDPLNGTDPTGLFCLWGCITHGVATGFDHARHFVATHKVVDGVVLGVLSVATGGGALVFAGALEASTATALGATALASGLGASALDERACVKGHSAVACGGFALGAAGSFAGGAGFFGSALGLSSFTQYQVGAFSVTAGVISTIYDAMVALLKKFPSRKRR